MKSSLFTTLLAGASALAVVASASAETPKVTIGGTIDFQAAIANDDADASQRAQSFRNDTEVLVSVTGKSDTGMNYGAEISLEGDVSADGANQGLNASRTFLFLDHGWGRFELGSNAGAAQAMKLDAASIARGTGGIGGDWWRFVGNGSVLTAPFISAPVLPTTHGSLLIAGGVGDTWNNNKITYYSPRWSGLQVGASYTPDQSDRGQTVTRLDNEAGEAGNIFDLGLNYSRQWDQVLLGLAATGMIGDAETSTNEDLRAWNVGATLAYMGFSFAGSYGDWSDSLNGNGNDSDYWSLGAAYDMGAFGASVTYLDSTYETAAGDDNFDNVVVSLDYKLAPGLTPYVEYSNYEFDGPAAIADNDGSVFLIGTQLAF